MVRMFWVMTGLKLKSTRVINARIFLLIVLLISRMYSYSFNDLILK